MYALEVDWLLDQSYNGQQITKHSGHETRTQLSCDK